MIGKILYVEDSAEQAATTLREGLLSGLISADCKTELENLCNNGCVKQAMPSFVSKSSVSPTTSIKRDTLKRVMDKDPRIVYHHSFLPALEYICKNYNDIQFCILDRNLQYSGGQQEDIKNKCEELGLNFIDGDWYFIFPSGGDKNHQREGDYLLQILLEKAGDEMLENVYYLSAYDNDIKKKDRHHAFVLRKFGEDNYIDKNDEAKLETLKHRLEESCKIDCYDKVQKYFPNVFDVVTEQKLRDFLFQVIKRYENNEQTENQFEDYFSNFRQIIEGVYFYASQCPYEALQKQAQCNNNAPHINIRTMFETQLNKDRKRIRSCKRDKTEYRFHINFPHDQLVDLLNTIETIESNNLVEWMLNSWKTQRETLLRSPITALDVAYTICCDMIHNPIRTDLSKQSNWLKDKSNVDFMQRYVYESVKIFFAWLGGARKGRYKLESQQRN